MTALTGKQQAVVLTDWPQPATVSEPQVMADDTTLSLMYKTNGDRYAVVRFPLCTYFTFGQPNDEARRPSTGAGRVAALLGPRGPRVRGGRRVGTTQFHPPKARPSVVFESAAFRVHFSGQYA